VGDNIRLRGFSAAGDIYLDGVRIAQYRDTFNYDRVEVLRGAASMLCPRLHRRRGQPGQQTATPDHRA
jgi:catecholate siderophore receptor